MGVSVAYHITCKILGKDKKTAGRRRMSASQRTGGADYFFPFLRHAPFFWRLDGARRRNIHEEIQQ